MISEGAWSIIIVGCGATGSHLISMLSQFAINNKFINNITIVDRDVIMKKNLRNQKFTIKDVGKNKAEVLSTRYRKLGININFLDIFISSKEDILEIVNQDILDCTRNIMVVSCVDNNKARAYLNDSFYSLVGNEKLKRFVYIDTGSGDVDSRRGQTIVGELHNGNVVYEAVGHYYPEIYEEEVEVVENNASCMEMAIEKPQHFATNVMSATVVFLLLTNIISNPQETIKTNFYTFDSDLTSIKSY